MMIYRFYNLAGKLIWSLDEEQRAEENACRPGYETQAAIQLLFKNFPTQPSTTDMAQVGTRDDFEQWSVGPFDILVKKEMAQ